MFGRVHLDSVPQWQRQAAQNRWEQERHAGAALFKHLLGLYATAKVTAKDLTIAFHYCSEAGMSGADFACYSVHPGQTSDGKYQRKLDHCLPQQIPLYQIDIPTAARAGHRIVASVPTNLMHESFAKEVELTPSMINDNYLERWPASYRDHPLVKRCVESGEDLPIPYALYIDGVRYTAPLAGRTDSCLGIWMYSLATKRRHLVVNVRQKLVCRCGCRGWCTIQPLLSMVAWCVQLLSEGRRPVARHDSSVSKDPMLKQLADAKGGMLGFRGVLVHLKGDWAEVSHTLGLPSVASKHAPCPFCASSSAALHTMYRSCSFPSRESNYLGWCAAREVAIFARH